MVSPAGEPRVTDEQNPRYGFRMSEPVMSKTELAKAAFFRRAMSLPPALMRRLAGPPVEIEGRTLSLQTQFMLRLQKVARERPAESFPVPQGRLALRAQALVAGGLQPIGQVHDRTVRGAAGPLTARLYVPRGVTRPGPMLVFFHGGGMIYGDLDSHDAVCRVLAEEAGLRVLSVDYRLAPEHPFPAGVEDAWAAYEWVASHAADYDADPTRLAVAGDSAGAYLSAVVALRAAREGVPLAFQLLLYPVTDMTASSESRQTYGRGFFLTTEFMTLATDLYLAGHDPKDPRASVLYADIPEGVAPALVTTAGFDPLRDEGQAYAERLDAAGVRVEHREYADQIHGYINLLTVEGSARTALLDSAAALRAALA